MKTRFNKIIKKNYRVPAQFPKKFPTKVKVDPRPDKEPHLAEMGRMLRLMSMKGVPEKSIKPKWGEGDIESVLYSVEGEEPQVVAIFSWTDGWRINDVPLQALLKPDAVSEASVLQDLRLL